MRWMIGLILLCLASSACTVGVVKREPTQPIGSATPTRVEVEGAGTTPTVPGVAFTFTPSALPVGSLPAPTPSATLPPAPTLTLPPSATPPPVPAPTLLPSPTGTAAPTFPPLAILSFTVDVEELEPGKRFTCNWETIGAEQVILMIGTRLRFQPWWVVEASGTFTFEQRLTFFPNPNVTLTARDGQDSEILQSVPVGWPCQYEYFFEPGPSDCSGLAMCYCPAYEPTHTAAAEQSFENGRMIWLREMHYEGQVVENAIFVLYADGNGWQFQDTWTPDEPESDPSIVPPPGFYQPIRGFGKVWRENPEVREKLGWALAPEQGFEGTWQPQIHESLLGYEYMRTLDNRIIRYIGSRWSSGRWQWED